MTRAPDRLQWPAEQARTPASWRRRARFHTGVVDASQGILASVKLLGGSRAVITSDMPARRDGTPLATGREPMDPGVAVWWVSKAGKEMVVACDRWDRFGANLQAINLTLEALRGLERWGSSTLVEKAFAGFAALPPGESGTPEAQLESMSWREVLGGSWPEDIESADVLAIAKARHRRLVYDVHPDHASDPEDAMRRERETIHLNVAFAQAEKELAG